MWELENDTPFKADRTILRDVQGREVWVVALKATYDILPDGSLEISRDQQEVLASPQYFENDADKGLLYDTDLSLPGFSTDILINGRAYPGNDKPTSETSVSLHVGDIKKELLITGDRYWDTILGKRTMSSPEPFDSIVLNWTNAYGGSVLDKESGDTITEPANPAGTGFAVKKSELKGVRLPNIEYAHQRVSNLKPFGIPAGFGAVARGWQPRADFGGTFDKDWEDFRKPLLPKDLRPRFWQSAPLDQQTNAYLQGGEKIILLGMNPEGLLKFRLPELNVNFHTLIKHEKEHVSGTLKSVTIEPEISKLMLVYQQALECHHREDQIQGTMIQVKDYE